MHDAQAYIQTLYEGVVFLLVMGFTTDPWEAARRIYLVVQYIKLLRELVKKFR